MKTHTEQAFLVILSEAKDLGHEDRVSSARSFAVFAAQDDVTATF